MAVTDIPDADALRISGVSHRFGNTPVLRNVDLAIRDGEFVTLLGPSGCGKTTLLRVAAGFVRPDVGTIEIGGIDVTSVPPHRRPVNMVFQRPTLFPHLDVGGNVAFGLRLAHVPDEKIRRRVRETLELVRLGGYESRRSHELSGGQMQRVALARVLIARPRVLLLDEPLSALDLAIRLEMEEELRRLHRETGTTFVYVTHDQREALALSDRVAVLNNGCIEQIGPPNAIYRNPATPFVARFVGDANVVPVELVSAGGTPAAHIGTATLRLAAPPPQTGRAFLVLRPEAIRLTPQPGPAGALSGRITDFSYRGAAHAYRVAVDGLAEALKVEMAADRAPPLAIGETVAIAWDPAAAILLSRET